MAETTKIIHPPETVDDSGEPFVMLMGRGDQPLASQLQRSGYKMTIASPRHPEMEPNDAKARIEDVSWVLDHLRRVLGGAGVLAVRLESVDGTSKNDEYNLSILESLLRDKGLRDNIPTETGGAILQIPPFYEGDVSRIGIIASGLYAQIVTHDGELITQILSRLPSPTNSIHS